MPSSQRPFFLSSFLAAFRQQPATTSVLSTASSQTNKHTTQQQTASTSNTAGSTSRALSASASNQTSTSASSRTGNDRGTTTGGVMNQLPLHSPHRNAHGMPIPGATSPVNGMSAVGSPIGSAGARRRGSDSSSEGFRDVLGADKWYIGGRTAGGDERFFKLGVVRRVRSNDRLSLDQLSL